jgi:hypothetical protein
MIKEKDLLRKFNLLMLRMELQWKKMEKQFKENTNAEEQNVPVPPGGQPGVSSEPVRDFPVGPDSGESGLGPV